MTIHRTAEYYDHLRDLRKHDPRPGEKDFPARLDKPLTTAMDIVVLVKQLPNYSDCERLIEQYAGMVAADARVEETRAALERLEAMRGGVNAQA